MNRRARTIELLTAHRPADSVESRHRERMLDLIEHPADVFSRCRFDPGHFTVSALVLSTSEASLLMVFHTGLQRWLQPGGHVEPSDVELQAAARREVVEETGLPDEALADVRGGAFDLDVHAIPRSANEPGHLHYDVRFSFRARSTVLGPATDPHGVRWVPLEEAAHLNPEPAMNRILKKLALQPTIDSLEER